MGFDTSQLIARLNAFASETPDQVLRRKIKEVLDALQRGQSPEELATIYPDLSVLLLSAFSNDSSITGDAFAQQLASHRADRSRLFRAIAYPLGLLLVACFVLAGVCSLIIPMFDRMFSEFGIELPAPTIILLNVSRFFNESPALFFAIVGLVGTALVVVGYVVSSQELRYRILGSPSAYSRSVGLANWTSRMADLLALGLPIEQALRGAAQSSDALFRDLSETLVRNVVTGRAPEIGILPPNLLFALGLNSVNPSGENDLLELSSPNLSMLQELSELYRERASDHREDSMNTVSAFAVIMVGMLVGFVVLALMMPLVSLISGLS